MIAMDWLICRIDTSNDLIGWIIKSHKKTISHWITHCPTSSIIIVVAIHRTGIQWRRSLHCSL